MTKNLLQRKSGSSLESHVYQFTQYPQSSFTTQRLSNARTLTTQNIITVPPNGKSNFTTGQWRALNLKLDPTGGYGTQDEGANLTFGFANEGNGSFSAACGFTLGIPPFHATHVNTVSRSIAYGFIINPFPTNIGLYIVHENNLIQQQANILIASLSIGIKDGVVTYKSGNATLLTLPMSNTSMVLYVVGCLGFDKNKITDLSLSGGNSALLTAPDFTKEIYIPCKGLTANFHNGISQQYPIGTLKTSASTDNFTETVNDTTNIQIRVAQGESFTVYYPDGTEQNFQWGTNNSYVNIGTNKEISTFSPFTLKVKFNNLNQLTGIRIINPLISTEVSLNRSLQLLSNLKEIELRSAFSSSFNIFHPTIGENLPLPNPSTLEKANIEGSFQFKEHDLSRQQSLTNLFLSTHFNDTTFPKICSARNLTYFETTSVVPDQLLSNFRNVFRGGNQRTTGSHGIRLTSGGSNSTLSQPNSIDLAIAQQSYMLMYGKTSVDSNNGEFIFPTSGFGVVFPSNQPSRSNVSVTLTNQEGLPTTYTVSVRRFIVEKVGSDGQVILYLHQSVAPPEAQELICVRTVGNANLNPNNHQLRKIISVVSNPTTVQFPTNNPGVNVPLVYNKVTITTKRVNESILINGLTVVDNNANQQNTLSVTKTGADFSNIEVGDSLWDTTTDSTPSTQGDDFQPAIVIRKEDNGAKLIVLNSSGSTTGPRINTGSSRSIMFKWEWSLQTDSFVDTDPTTYPVDRVINPVDNTNNLSDLIASDPTFSGGRMTQLFTNGQAAYAFLISPQS